MIGDLYAVPPPAEAGPPVGSGALAAALAAGLAQAPEQGPWGDRWPWRASSVPTLCPRHCALVARGLAPRRGGVDAETAWRMARGTGNHVWVQHALTALPGVALLGGWRAEDGTVVWGPPEAGARLVRPEALTDPDAGPVGWAARPADGPWAYVECAGRDDGLGLRGHWDGVLRWPDGRLELLEIKSWPVERRAVVDPTQGGRPLAKHLEQVHAYLYLSGLRAARIVYIMGGANIAAALCEHAVAWEDACWEIVEARLRACAAALRMVADDPAGRALPDRLPACGSRSDARTRECPGRDACLPARGVRW